MTESEDSNQGTSSRSKEEKKRKILSVLEKNPEGLFPKPVARYADLKHSTVRSYLRELEKEGKVENKSGIYSVVEGDHKGNMSLPNVQNMRLKLDLPEDVDVEHKKIERNFPFADMTIEVGKTHHRATGSISADPPISIEAGYLLGEVFAEEVESTVGYETDSVEEVEVTTVEFSEDSWGIRMDGLNSITIRDLHNKVEEKLYNKKDRVRHETRLLQPVDLDTIGGLVTKGVTYSDLSKRYRNIENKVGKVHEDYQKMVEGLVRTNKLNRKLLDKLDEIRDGLQEVNFSKEGEPNG